MESNPTKLFVHGLEQMIHNANQAHDVHEQRLLALRDVYTLAQVSGLIADRWEATIKEMLSTGDKITAIKFYREKTGCTLKEAKDYVDGLTQTA